MKKIIYKITFYIITIFSSNLFAGDMIGYSKSAYNINDSSVIWSFYSASGAKPDITLFQKENNNQKQIIEKFSYLFNGIFFDLYDSNIIWLAGKENLLNYNIKTNKFVYFPYKDIRTINNDISDSTIIWLGSGNGLYKFNKNKNILIHIDKRINKKLHIINTIFDIGKKLLIGTNGKGILIFNKDTLTISTKFIKSKWKINNIILLSEDIIWYSSNQGYGLINLKKENLLPSIFKDNITDARKENNKINFITRTYNENDNRITNMLYSYDIFTGNILLLNNHLRNSYF